MKLIRQLLASRNRLCPNQTKTQTCSFSSLSVRKSKNFDTLYKRVAPIRDKNVSVVPVLDQWVGEGKPIRVDDLRRMIKQFRRFERYNHALQISKWMGGQEYLDVTDMDMAVQLDLVFKVHGLVKAEEYFDSIPTSSRVWQVYAALLNCYAGVKNLKEAEDTFEKMRELGYAGSLSYNVMLGLYSKTGRHEMLDTLMEEMEKRGIKFDNVTYNIRLHAFSASSNIEQMETFLRKMEADPGIKVDFTGYSTAANGYFKAGETEKALKLLKVSENLIKVNERKSAYEFLLTMYARLGRKDEVYRIWTLYKQMGLVFNMSYLCMMSSLAILDDLDGVENVYEEWEAGKNEVFWKIPNFLITAYCKRGLLEKAELLVERMTECGNEPNAGTFSRMAMGYLKQNKTEKVVETIKKAIRLSCHGGWSVDIGTFAICLEHLHKTGDRDATGDIIRSIREKDHSWTVEFKEKLVKYYGKRSGEHKELMKMLELGNLEAEDINQSIASQV